MKISLNREEIEQAIICYVNKRGNVVDVTKARFTITGQTAIVDLDFDGDVEAKEKTEAIVDAMETNDDTSGVNNIVDKGFITGQEILKEEPFVAPTEAQVETDTSTEEHPSSVVMDEPAPVSDVVPDSAPVGSFNAPKGFGS